MSSLFRLLLIVGVILGVVLPKSSAALAGLGVIDARVVVICTGQGMQMIAVDDDGNPVPQVHAQTGMPPCLLVHALDGVTPPPTPGWVLAARQFRPAPHVALSPDQSDPTVRFARGPPRNGGFDRAA